MQLTELTVRELYGLAHAIQAELFRRQWWIAALILGAAAIYFGVAYLKGRSR